MLQATYTEEQTAYQSAKTVVFILFVSCFVTAFACCQTVEFAEVCSFCARLGGEHAENWENARSKLKLDHLKPD